MSWKSYQKKLFNFADKNDEWDPEAEDRWNQQTQVLMQEHPERFDENGNMKIGVVDDTMPIRNMRTGEIITPTAQQGTETPTTEDITGVPLHPENSPMVTSEQGYQYANQQLNMLNDNQKSTLQDWVDDLKAYLTQTQTNAQNKNPFGDFVGSDSSVKLAERAQQEKQALIDSGMPDVSHDNVDNMRQWREYQEYVDDYEDRQRQQEELANMSGAELEAVRDIGAITSPLSNLAAGFGAMEKPLDSNLGRNLNGRNNLLSNLNKDIDEEQHKKIEELAGNGVMGDALKFLYDTKNATIESLSSMAIGANALGALGAGEGVLTNLAGSAMASVGGGGAAYANQIEDGMRRGLTEEEAEKEALVAAAIEMGTEAAGGILGMDVLRSVGKKLTGKAATELTKEVGESLTKKMLGEVASEAGEELVGNIAYSIADNIITGDKSVYNQAVKDYQAQGMSEEEARAQAKTDWIKDTAKEMAIAGLSAGVTMGGAAAVSTVAERSEAKKLDGNYKNVADAIPNNVEDYQDEEAYNKAMEVKEKALQLDEAPKVTGGERVELLKDLYAVNETMPEVDLIENINESVNSPFADVGGFSVAKNNMTSQDVAQTMAEASKSNDVNLFVEAYRDSQASQDLQARQTGQQYFDTLSPKFDSYDTGDQNLQTALSLRSAEDIYTAAKNGEEINDYEINTQRKQEALQSGIIERTQYLAQQQQAKVQEENRTINPKKIETKQGTFNARDLSYNEKTDTFTVTKNGEEIEIPKKDISNRAMQTFVTNAYEQPTASATQLYIESYDASVPIGSYNQAFNSAITAGAQQGYSFDAWLNNHKYYTKALSKKTLKKIFDEGAQEKKTSVKKKNKAEGKVNIASNVQIDNDDIFIQMTKAYAKKAKIDVEITEQGLKVGDKYARGALQPSIEKLTLAKNNDAKLQTFFHEGVGEFLQAYNPEDMKAIQASILEYLRDTKGEDWVTNNINRYMKRYKSADYNTVREAANELVNDSIAGLMTTDKGIEDFMNWAVKEDKTLLDKIKDFLNALVEKIHDLIENGGLEEASLSTAKMTEKKAKELRQRIFDAMDKAIEGSSTTTEQIEEPKAASYESRQSLDSLEDKARFDLGEPVEKKGNLIAVHNMGASELLQTIELGGFPMPSIAVIKANQGHEKYGNTSVLFYKDTIDPKKSKKNKIYGGDAWTPTFPSIEYKVDARVADKIRETIDNLVSYDEQREMRFLPLDNDNLETSLNNTRGNIEKTFEGNETMQLAFLRDKGIDLVVPSEEKRLDEKFTNEQIVEVAKLVDGLKEAEQLRMSSSKYDESEQLIEKMRNVLNKQAKEYYKGYVEDLYDELTFTDFDHLTRGIYRYYKNGIGQQLDNKALNEAIREEIKTRKDEYDKWLHELFDGIIEKTGLRNNKEYFTYSGNKRSWETLHDDYTLDNIVKIMSQQDDRGANAFFSQSAIKGLATRTFNNLKEVKNSASQLRSETEEEHEQRIEEQSNRFTEICQEIMDKKEDNQFIAFGRASDAIAEVIKDHRTVKGIDKELREYTSLNIQDDTAQKIVDLLKDIENNPTEYFEAKPKRAVGLEEIARVVTPSNEKELIDALEENNIPYSTYEAGNEEDRLNKLNAVEDVRFSLAVDTEGNELTEGQQEYFKDSKVVDSNGRLQVLYHQTDNDFTVFDTKRKGAGHNDFLTPFGIFLKPNDKNIGVSGNKQMKLYANITNILEVNDRMDLKEVLYQNDNIMQGRIELDKIDKDYNAKHEKAEKEWETYVFSQSGRRVHDDKSNELLDKAAAINDEWGEVYDKKAKEVKKLTDEYIKSLGYDGVHIKRDEGSFGRVVETYIAFSPNQVKNVDNENPTDNADIRYSLDTEDNELSEQQQEFFKDSKVRDDQGRLQVLYHGTANRFYVYDNDKIGDNYNGWLQLGNGFYFTDDRKVAKGFAKTAAKKNNKGLFSRNVQSVYLNLVNPYIVGETQEDDVYELDERKALTIDRDKLIKLGYDGIIYKPQISSEPNQYVAFNSNQIKEVTNTNPTESEDIRYSLDVPTTYVAGNEEAREAAVNSVEDVRFSFDVDTRYDLIGVDELTEEELNALFPSDENGKYRSIVDDYKITRDAKDAFISVIKGANKAVDTNITDAQVDDIAERIIKKYSSTKGTQYVANNLRGIFDAMFEYDNYNDIVNALMNLSEEIVETSKAIDPKDQELYDNLLKVIPKFSLTEEQRQEAIYKYGDWGAVFGKIGRFMDKNAPSLDASWSEARDNILSATGHDIGEFANTNNQVDEIIEALDLYRPRSRNMYAGADTTDVALTTAMEIMQDFYSTAMTEKDTSASVKRSLNKQMNDYKKQVEQDYKERLKEAKKEYKEKNDELKRLFGENSKHVADMERLMRRAERKAQRGRDSLSRYKERQERTRRLNSIKRSGTRLMRMIEKPSKNKYVPDILKKPIIDMVTSIDFMTRKKDGTLYRENSNTNRMWREKFNSMQDILSQLSDVAMSDVTGRQPKIMRDKSVAQRNEIYNIATHVNGIVKTFFDTFYDSAKDKQVSIYGLNNEELYSLDQFLKSLSAVANNAPTLLKNASFASVDELANKSLQEIHELNTLDRTKGGIRAFAMSLNEPITYFEKLGKAPRSIYNEFLEGELLYLQRIREAGDAFEEKKKDMNLKNSEVRKWDKDIRDFEVEGEGTLRLNIPQVMYMYALYPREQAKYHFLLGGVTAKELEIDLANKRKNKSYKRQVKPIRLNGEDVERITSILTPQQKELADYMVKYLSTTVSGWGNNVSQAQYGIDTFTEPHYMPITSDPNNIKTNVNNANQNVNIWSLQNKGFTKETVERASNPIMIDDIFNVFTNHIAEMAQYEGFVLPIQDAMRFYNYETEDATTQDATIKAAINRVMGDAGKEYFTRFIEDANRSNRTYNDLDKINKFLSRNKAQAVMANSRVVIQQPTAYVRAGEVIEEKYLAKSVALTAVHLKKYADLSKEHSPLSWYKSKGYYDVMIGQDLQELITGKATISEKINDFMGAPAGIADDLTWGMLYRASMLKVEDSKAYKDGKFKKDSDEYFDAVNDIFHEIIIKTQVVDTFLTKSQIMRNQEIGHKLATSFMAEPIKSFNMLNRGVWDWAQGKSKKKLAKAIAVYGVTNILVGVVTSMVDAWRDNDEDKPFSDRFLNKWLGIEDVQNAKNPWDYVKAVWGANAFDSLNPINMIPVVKEVSSAIMGYDNANMSTAFIYQALDLAKSFVNGSSTKTAYGYIYNTAQVVSLMTGVPVANVMRESKDLYNNLNDLWGGENIVKSKKNTGVNDKIFKAFDENGDYKAEIDERKQELIEYYLSEDKTQAEAEKQAQSTITSAITSQYKPQLVELYKTDINQANLLKQRLIDMNVAAGKTRDKANKDINKWVK